MHPPRDLYLLADELEAPAGSCPSATWVAGVELLDGRALTPVAPQALHHFTSPRPEQPARWRAVAVPVGGDLGE